MTLSQKHDKSQSLTNGQNPHPQQQQTGTNN